MSNIQTVKNKITSTRVRPMSVEVAEVRHGINLIQEALKATMKNGVHFGVIPGTQKPSLYKPGAEIIMALFRLSAYPSVNDMSKDGEIRYQVKVELVAKDGASLGEGIGECSSGEEKYMWRVAVCDEEFDDTPETMRRIKYKKYRGEVSKARQVRMNPSDLANTILKMAKKRALIDAVLTATGASDIFSQDIEDLPEEFLKTHEDGVEAEQRAPIQEAPIKEATTKTMEEEAIEMMGEDVEIAGWGTKLSDIREGGNLLEVDMEVIAVNVYPDTGKSGKTSFNVKDADGKEYFIGRWGKSDPEKYIGKSCTFFEVNRGKDYNGKPQYMAKDVKV